MSTLPLDLILHIIDVGDLSLKDVFALYQTNRLLRLKLSHPYFWHSVYNMFFVSLYESLDLPTKKNRSDYHFEECKLLYRRELELDESIKSECLNQKPNSRLHFSKRIELEFSWNSEMHKRYLMDPTYLPALLKKFMLEESRLFKFVCVEKISTTFNLRKVAVLQYLISNQIYKIGLDHLKRLGDVPMSYTYYESVFFYLSLLEKSSFRNFHRRRKFLQHWGRLLRQNVVPELRKKIYGTQPPCSDYETRRNFFGMSFSFLLNRLKTFAVSGSGCEEEYDILKFYNGKKTQDFIVLAVILSICGREWDSLAKELGIGRNSRNSSTPILVMNIAVTENFVLTIGKEAVSVIDGTYSPDILKVVHEASRLNNLQVMLSTKSVGILNLDIQRLSRLPSIKASQSWYTEVNFTRKVRRYPEQSPEFGKKFRNIFIKVLQVYDSDLHSIVLREVCSEKEQLVVEEEETEGTEGGELFGTVVNTRTCPGIVTRKIEDDYYMVYNVNGEYEQPARRSLAPWVAKNGQELCSLITLLGLDRLFVLGFRMLIIDRNNRLVKFSKS